IHTAVRRQTRRIKQLRCRAIIARQHASVRVEQVQARTSPLLAQPDAVEPALVAAIQRAPSQWQGLWCWRRDIGQAWRPPVQTVNEEPQPQVVLALGLRITNWAPLRLSA